MTHATGTGRPPGTYDPGVSRLPLLRISGRPRPQAALWEDWVTMILGAFGLFALFMDGWRHNNMTGIDTFWSVAHILMYSGILALGAWIAIVLARHQESLKHLDWSAVPAGYGLAFLALPLAMIAGPADFNWHAAFGFENQIDSTYSPPHQGLFLAGALLAAIPAASAWQRRSTTPSLREFLPAAIAIASTITMVLFVIHQVVPFYSAGAMTEAFQQDLAGRVDAFAGGDGALHKEGLSPALQHFGDDAFPYYFYSTQTTMAGILMFSMILFGGVLLMRKRWRPPFGSLTLMFTWIALLFPLLSEYREWHLGLSLILAGIVGDVLLATLVGGSESSTVRMGRIRLFAALMPVVLWSLYFVGVELFKGGLAWNATLWTGVLTTTAAFCYSVSLIVFAPLVGGGAATEQVGNTRR